VLALAPAYAPGSLSKGFILEAKGQPEEARGCYQQALRNAADASQRQEARQALTSLNENALAPEPAP
jgi:predicted negative regulator of RcsB-dependent stress response